MKPIRTRTSAARGGFTLIEALLATSLLTVAAGSAVMAMNSSYRAYENARTTLQLDDQARRVLSRVATLLTSADSGLLVPDPDDEWGTSTLTFQEVIGIDGTSPELGPLGRIAFEYDEAELDDGLDNDGDGLVDEGRIVLVRDVGGADEKSVVLCNGVAELAVGEQRNAVDDDGNGVIDEAGFHLHRDGNVLTIRVSLQGLDEGGNLVERELETTVRMRN